MFLSVVREKILQIFCVCRRLHGIINLIRYYKYTQCLFYMMDTGAAYFHTVLPEGWREI